MVQKIELGFSSSSPFLELTEATLSGIEDAGGIKLDVVQRENLAGILRQYQQDYTRWLARALLELEQSASASADLVRSSIFFNLPLVKHSQTKALRRLKFFNL